MSVESGPLSRTEFFGKPNGTIAGVGSVGVDEILPGTYALPDAPPGSKESISHPVLQEFRSRPRPDEGFPHGLPTGEKSAGGTIGNWELSVQKLRKSGIIELATQESRHPGYGGYLNALKEAGIIMHTTEHDGKPTHGLILPTETALNGETIRDRAIKSANGGLPLIEVPSDMLIRADLVAVANMGGEDWEKTLNNISDEIDGKKPKIFIGGSQIGKALKEKIALEKIGEKSEKVAAIKRFLRGSTAFNNETEAGDTVRLYNEVPEPTAQGLVRQFQRLTGVTFASITFGPQGAYLIDPEQTVHHHTAPIEGGLHPLGMGDQHAGGMTHGLITGETIESTLINARNGAVNVGRHPTAQTNQITREQWIPNTTVAQHEGHRYETHEVTDKPRTHIEVFADVPQTDHVLFEQRRRPS